MFTFSKNRKKKARGHSRPETGPPPLPITGTVGIAASTGVLADGVIGAKVTWEKGIDEDKEQNPNPDPLIELKSNKTPAQDQGSRPSKKEPAQGQGSSPSKKEPAPPSGLLSLFTLSARNKDAVAVDGVNAQGHGHPSPHHMDTKPQDIPHITVTDDHISSKKKSDPERKQDDHVSSKKKSDPERKDDYFSLKKSEPERKRSLLPTPNNKSVERKSVQLLDVAIALTPTEDEDLLTPEELARKNEEERQRLRDEGFLFPGQIYYDKERVYWKRNNSNILTMIGFAVGLSNIWRFPYLCFQYGGGAFLIPYFFFLIVCGIPILYLEMIVGQFTQSGMIGVWKLVPIFRGIGLCQCMLPILIAFFYNTMLAWALLYCVESVIRTKVPWVGCFHPWNTRHCREIEPDFSPVAVVPGQLRAGAEFFRGRVQQKWNSLYADPDSEHGSDLGAGKIIYGIGDRYQGLGNPSLEMSVYLFVVYAVLLVYLRTGLWQRGRSLFVDIVTPFVIMVLLLYRGLPLPGAIDGIKFLFKPDPTILMTHEPWVAAAQQVFFSLGSGLGIHMTLASHNHFDHDILFDTVATALIDTGASLLCAILVFINLGSMAYSENISIDKFISQGPDLLFEACADALGRLPGANFYNFVFFLMILLLGFESTLGALVCSLQSLLDVWGVWLDRNGAARGLFVNTTMILAFMASLLCVTRGGLHMFIFFDFYSAGAPLILCCLLMCIALAWFWGLEGINDASEEMMGTTPSLYFQVCWKYLCPGLLSVLLVLNMMTGYKPEYVDRHYRDFSNTKPVVFPQWFIQLGSLYRYFPSLGFLIGIIWYWWTSNGKTAKEKLLLGISPDYEHEEIRTTGKCRRAKLSHYSSSYKRQVAPEEGHPNDEDVIGNNNLHIETDSEVPTSQVFPTEV